MTDGHRYTVPAAIQLKQRLVEQAFDVFFDHGDAAEAHTIVVWAGHAYVPPQRPKQLAHLDIAVVDPASDHVICLVEIEDTAHNPKTLIGDLLAPMLGSGIAIGNKADYVVDEAATLIVFAHFKNEQEQQIYAERLAHIQKGIARIYTALAREGIAFGRCILDSFLDQEQLDQRLWDHVRPAIARYRARHP
jgi:hypothetical protein